MVHREIPYRYYNAGASANTSYLAHTLNTTAKSSVVSSDRSTNFLKVKVFYTSGSGTSMKTLYATLYLCITANNSASPALFYFPQGNTLDNEFPLVGLNNDKYADLKYPDDVNYYDYFKISFGLQSGANIGVYIQTPNVNGRLMVETTQTYFEA